jgi:hypothetical protein
LRKGRQGSGAGMSNYRELVVAVVDSTREIAATNKRERPLPDWCPEAREEQRELQGSRE